MRILERDKKQIYYAKYVGKSETMKTVKGNEMRTGSYEETYTEPQAVMAYVSIPKGTRQGGFGKAETTERGNVTSYLRQVICEQDLGLSVNDVMWIGIEPTERPNYRIQTVGDSFHHSVYLVMQL